MIYTVEVSSYEVYGGEVDIPSGFEFVAFQSPRLDDTFLATRTRRPVAAVSNALGPRIIVRKKPIRRVTFVETGEVRIPQADEWFRGKRWFEQADLTMGSESPIYTMTETEE